VANRPTHLTHCLGHNFRKLKKFIKDCYMQKGVKKMSDKFTKKPVSKKDCVVCGDFARITDYCSKECLLNDRIVARLKMLEEAVRGE